MCSSGCSNYDVWGWRLRTNVELFLAFNIKYIRIGLEVYSYQSVVHSNLSYQVSSCITGLWPDKTCILLWQFNVVEITTPADGDNVAFYKGLSSWLSQWSDKTGMIIWDWLFVIVEMVQLTESVCIIFNPFECWYVARCQEYSRLDNYISCYSV